MKEKIEVLNILMLSVHNQKQIVQRISLNQLNIITNPNKIFLKVTQMKFFKMLKQECVSKIDNFVKEFDGALTLETEGLKKMP